MVVAVFTLYVSSDCKKLIDYPVDVNCREKLATFSKIQGKARDRVKVLSCSNCRGDPLPSTELV